MSPAGADDAPGGTASGRDDARSAGAVPGAARGSIDDGAVPAGRVLVGVVVPLPHDIAAPINKVRVRHGLVAPGSGIDEHVTLLPPVPVPPDALAGIEAHLRDVAATRPPFPLALAGTDTFRPVSPVVFLRLVEGASDCDRLQRAVRTGPLRADLAFAYHPHVTVAHTDDDAALDAAARLFDDVRAAFTVSSFVLHGRRPGRVWEPVRSFRLGSPG